MKAKVRSETKKARIIAYEGPGVRTQGTDPLRPAESRNLCCDPQSAAKGTILTVREMPVRRCAPVKAVARRFTRILFATSLRATDAARKWGPGFPLAYT